VLNITHSNLERRQNLVLHDVLKDLERKQMEVIPYALVVVASTIEAEFVACFEATIQANWL